MIGKRLFCCAVALCSAMALGAPRAEAQCPGGQLDHDFDLGLAQVLLNRLLVDSNTQASLWDTGNGGLWQQIPTQVSPGFTGVDNTGDGIDDDDHLDLLAAIVNGDESVVANLNPGTVNTIRNSYNHNRAYLQQQEITINNVKVSALIINTTLNVTTGSTISLPIVGSQAIPSLWGINEANPDDGLLRSADPNLETLLLNMGAGYMTIGGTAEVEYMQAFIAQITLAVIQFVVPALLEDLKKVLDVPADAPVTVLSYQGPFGSGDDNDKAFTVNCGPITNISLSLQVSGINVTINIAKQDICNALQGFVNKFQCGNGVTGFQCHGPLLSASGDLNGDGTTNLASYNASANRQEFLTSEGILNPPLEISSVPVDTTVNAGASVNLEAGVSGGSGGAVTIDWELINPEDFGRVTVLHTGATYDIDYALPAQSIAALGISVCDGLWSRRSLPFALTINNIPFAITQQPVGIENTIPGESHTMTVAVAGGTAIPTYQWQRKIEDTWVNIDGAQTTSLTIDPLELSDTGFYRVQISGANDAPVVLTSNEVFIEVEDRIRFTTHPENGRLYVGGEHTFTVEIAGTPDGDLNIQWQKDDVDIPGADELSLTVSDAQLDDNGVYVCVISDDSHVVSSNPATLEVAEDLSIVTDPVGGTIFEGTSFTFSVVTNGGLGPFTYVWTKEGVGQVGPNSADFNLNPVALTDAGTYSVTVTDVNNQTATSGTATINVIPPFEITTQPAGKLDFEGSATHTLNIDVVGGAPPFTFQWYKNNVPVGPARDAANRNLVLNGPLQVSDSGEYRCFVADTNGGKFSNVAVVDIRTHLTISQQPQNKAVYLGGSTQLTVGLSGGIGDRQFRWKKGSTTVAFTETLSITNAQAFSAGTYTVTVQDDFDTVTSDPVTITVGTPLEITQQPQNAWRFLGDTATFTVASVKGAGDLSYQWFHNDEEIEDSNSATLSIPGVTEEAVGEYYVVISDGVTSYQSETAVLTTVEPLASTGGDVNVSLDPSLTVPPSGLLSSAVCVGSIASTGGVTDNYILVASVVNTPLAGVTGVELRRGAPGQNGPLVEGLGVPASNSLSIFEVLTSAEAAEMVAGVHYMIYATATFPNGAIRGQVVVTPRPPAEEGEGEGVIEGEGAVDGEGAIDGEGAEEGEGAIEGEGAVDGEPEGEGEGTVDGEPEGEGEGFVEEGEGEDISPAVIQLLQDFSNGDLNHDGFLSLEELVAIAGENILDILDLLDANGDDLVQVSELLHIVGPIWIHNADINGDHVISLGDLLRAVQLFNQGGYSCADNAGATEDGFVATGAGVPCVRHAADYSNGEDGDGAISLQELLRLIQLYNAGGYAYCPGQQPVEDGFCIEAL